MFLQVCLWLLSVLSLLFRWLFCLRLFLSVFLGGFYSHNIPPVRTRDSTHLPCPSSPNLVFICLLAARACTNDWQRSSATRFASFPCPNPRLCSPASMHTHECPPWAYVNIPNPLFCACHAALHFGMFCYVVHGGLAWVFGAFACVFWGVSP